MNTLSAFIRGQANRDKELMVFDWDKAATLIYKRKAQSAGAGLSSDWDGTGGKIFGDGKPIAKDDTYLYLASTWAIPQLEVDGVLFDCFKMQSEVPAWDAKTFWPSSALKILKEGIRHA